MASPGDLVLRAGDDLLSQQIKYLNEKDPSYSHAGIIVSHNGEKMVCDIYPYANNADTIEYIPIDSFANPTRNLSCALYRYKLTPHEQAGFVQNLEQFQKNSVHFDKLYDLSTDDRLYCSEMIAKALERSTAGRINIRQINIPVRMRPLVTAYFKKTGATAQEVADRKYISLDNLYLIPECTMMLRFPLKYFPGK